MKTLSVLLLALLLNSVFAQENPEKEVKTEVNEVTVFLDGAQVVRKKAVELPIGKSTIKFVNLSPFINAKSIQVKADGNIMVLSVNHQQNYLNKVETSTELKDLYSQMETTDDKIKVENTYLSIVKEELAFLQENRNIGGKNEQVSVTNLQQAAEFYSNKLTALKLKEIERSKTIKKLTERKNDLQAQISALTAKKEYPSGEILVKVDAKNAGKYQMELTYLVENAGWYPSYDIRAKNITEPIQLVYKANIKQDTKVDWTNVKLRFSSANPNVNGVVPELKTYYLGYNTLPPTYKMTNNSVRGKVADTNGEPLPGATVFVTGTSIGTTADIDGNYTITIPNNSSQLSFQMVGFETETRPILGSVMNVALKENEAELEEVVVAYGRNDNVSNSLKGKVAGIATTGAAKVRGISSLSVPTVKVENQTTVDFEIKTPYNIKSDNKSYAVDMESYELPASYRYYCIPKIDKDAFLVANIVDWEKYNLLEGEANIFFEDTYVGKTLMDVRYATDTLELSLGRDKNVTVSREKVKDYTNKQLLGNKKEEMRTWKTTVKNNKSQPISMTIIDQVPVSTLEEIEVNVQKQSGAKQTTGTGEVKWEFELNPNDRKEFELSYSVKYPKNKTLIVE